MVGGVGQSTCKRAYRTVAISATWFADLGADLNRNEHDCLFGHQTVTVYGLPVVLRCTYLVQLEVFSGPRYAY